MAHEHWINPAERGDAANAVTVGHAPDFVRHDRGSDDDHWARALGAPCMRCGGLVEEHHYVRRRSSGEWVHETCPPPVQEILED